MSSSSDEEEFLDIESINNGLVLSNVFLPEEILLNLLIFASWKDLMSCRLVCETWKRIIDSVVCYEKLKMFNFKILKESFTGPLSELKSDSVPFYLYFAISKSAFGNNLLKNPFGAGDDPHVCQRDPNSWRDFNFRNRNQYMNRLLCGQIKTKRFCFGVSIKNRSRSAITGGHCPRFKHWGVLKSGGNGWVVEAEPQGCEPLPSHLPERSCFVTSFSWCKKEQIITLAEHGLSSAIMDEVQPQLDISEWFARRWDCGIRYKLNVFLLDSNKEVLQEFEVETGNLIQDSEWHEVTHSFKDYGPGVRYVQFVHAGTDSQYWAGHYGSKIAGGSVIARIPSSRFQRLCDSTL